MFQFIKTWLYLGIWPVALLGQTTWQESSLVAQLTLSIPLQQTDSATTSRPTQQAKEQQGNTPRRGRRRTRSVAASRGDCQVADEGLPQLLTIVPDIYDSSPLTTSARPTFWAYSPYQMNEGMRMEFVLYDRTDNDSSDRPLFAEDIEVVGPGIFSIPLPSDALELENGAVYEWFIKVYCDPEDIRPASDSALVTLAIGDTNSGVIWYDQVNLLASAIQQNAANQPQRAWENFLRRSRLDDLIEQPVLE